MVQYLSTFIRRNTVSWSGTVSFDMQQSILPLCVVLLSISVTCTYKQSSDFFRVTTNDNKYPTTDIVKEMVEVSSLASCSAICTRREDCSDFFYNRILRKCVCTGSTDQQGLQPGPGYVHFSSTGLCQTFHYLLW
jgi:hypothetical protein